MIIRKRLFYGRTSPASMKMRDTIRLSGRVGRHLRRPAAEPPTTRFRTGCNAMSKPLIRASEPSDHAVKPNSSPDPHRGPSKLDPGLDPGPRCPKGDRLCALAGLFCDRGDRI